MWGERDLETSMRLSRHRTGITCLTLLALAKLVPSSSPVTSEGSDCVLRH